MMTKEYKLPNGKIIMFDYDAYGVGQVTLEAMDMMVELLCKMTWIPCSDMNILADALRKTENSSEKPNNCDTQTERSE